ncbi:MULTISPECIES: hypothetical protein [Rhizobium]|uniref:hypothetical protein n=1 Tax=Rhizobium TaxID=379 RepID=UPI0004175AB7|nr:MULTISPECIES: hypothetical protein [Rhizobium]UFS81564.1 hypothetical protein LPB79_25160 [Rhizobium sp. T136]
MATTPEIKTKFTLDGLEKAATGLRGFVRTIGDTFSDARRRGNGVFDPLDKGLETVERKAKVVKNEFHQISTMSIFKGTFGALAAIRGLEFVAAKFKDIGAAAIDAAKKSAESLRDIGRDATKLGTSPQDIAALDYLGKRNGVDRDELVTQITTLNKEFLAVRKNIGLAGSAYQSFLGLEKKDAFLSFGTGGSDGLRSQMSGFWQRDIEARKQSQTDIDARLQQIGGQLDQYSVDPVTPGTGPNQSLLGFAARTALQRERQQLVEARNQFINSQSPQGQALFALQNHGLDFDRATKGGIDSLVAISEAFRRVADATERSSIAVNLFGEDAGAKLLPVLMEGEKAIRDYRKEMERLGGVITDADTARATKYENAVQDMRTALDGLGLEIGRQVQPALTQSITATTNWIVKSRLMIAQYVGEAFEGVRTFVTDVVSIFSGDGAEIQTKWLDALIKKTFVVRDLWSDVTKQIGLLWDGKDSDYRWLNVLRDGFREVKKFALDAWAVVTGGDAKNFQWLNSARDQIVAFAGRLSDAFGMLKDLLGSIRDFFKPVFDYLGQDILTFGLFLGLTRMLGLFGTLTTAAGLFAKALGAVFSLGGGAIAAGRAVAGVGSAAGAVAATASGLTASITAIGTAISTVVAGAAVLGVALAGAFYAGQKAAEFMLKGTEKAYETVWAAQAKLMAAQGDAALYERLGMRDDSARTKGAQRLVYEKQMGIKAPDPTYYMTAAEKQQYSRELQNSWMGWDKNYDGGDLAAVARDSEARRSSGPTLNYKIDINGNRASLSGGMDVKRALDALNNGFN